MQDWESCCPQRGRGQSYRRCFASFDCQPPGTEKSSAREKQSEATQRRKDGAWWHEKQQRHCQADKRNAWYGNQKCLYLFGSWWNFMFECISARSVKNNAPLAGQDFPDLGAAAPPAQIQRYVCSVFSNMGRFYVFFPCRNTKIISFLEGLAFLIIILFRY